MNNTSKDSSKKGKIPFILISVFVLFAFLGGVFSYFYFFHFHENKEIPKDKIESEIKKSDGTKERNLELITRLESMIEENKRSIVTELSKSRERNLSRHGSLDDMNRVKEILPPTPKDQKDENLALNEDLEYGVLDQIQEEHVYREIKIDKSKLKKPKLAIVIDDIGLAHQLNRLLALNLKITPSIFPSNSFHPQSAELAKKARGNYIIHLPLEALNHANPEEHTIKSDDTREVIEEKISKVRSMFPDAKYVNNHTGSRFTANLESMEVLLDVLKRHNFIFIDSKTSPYSKANQIDSTILTRDIFLDNIKSEEYILKQLKKALKRAEKRGFAIAIGHPYSATFATLNNNRELFKSVELVYIDELREFVENSLK